MTLSEFKTHMLLDQWNYTHRDFPIELGSSDILTSHHRWVKGKESLEFYDDGISSNDLVAEIVYNSPSGLTRPGVSSALSMMFTSFQEAYDYITRRN